MEWKVLSEWKRGLKIIGVCVVFAILSFVWAYQVKQAMLAEDLSGKILRFHVLANSDSQQDQELKLKVRDTIGAYMQTVLAGAESLSDSQQIVAQKLDEIEARAEAVILEQGYQYEVKASLANVDFPRKVYGDYGFPAGEYEALQVVIGEGKGQNWWCVMYPNMCFYNSIYEVVEDEADKSLQQVLTTEEYKAVMENGSYEVKFKWLSFLNFK